MGYGIKLMVWGDYACFTRPEMKIERVSYDVITPSAARGILEAIHWKPAIRWEIDRIHVLNPIKFDNIRRNELKSKAALPSKAVMQGNPSLLFQDINGDGERQQKASLVLRDVLYIIEAHFVMTPKAGFADNEDKHYAIFCERARYGRCFHHPYLGCREFTANFELIEDGKELPESCYKGMEKDLGWMLRDICFDKNMTPQFFRAVMRDGIIEVPEIKQGGVGFC